MAGYSPTPLIRKLGIPASGRAVFLREPDQYRSLLGPLPPALRVLARLGKEMDFIHLFARDRRELEPWLGRARSKLAKSGTLWISWPKKASGIATDLSDSVVRERGLASGLVDVKVCAVDDTWSGLKFVYRLQDR